ncbi:MAG: hypothetical protein IH840_00105 [Candidatus Heimdallarchaeota archaeon]|nr:hypothetical protein [Candidatus Heimdallarchaeota archaeon]
MYIHVYTFVNQTIDKIPSHISSMNKADVALMLQHIQKNSTISVSDLSKLVSLPTRRLYDCIPTLQALGIVTRPSRGMVAWVEQKPVVEEPKSTTVSFESHMLQVSSKGVITSVKTLDAMSLIIESTAPGFSVNPLVR